MKGFSSLLLLWILPTLYLIGRLWRGNFSRIMYRDAVDKVKGILDEVEWATYCRKFGDRTPAMHWWMGTARQNTSSGHRQRSKCNRSCTFMPQSQMLRAPYDNVLVVRLSFFQTSYDSTSTVAYAVTYLETPYGVREKSPDHIVRRSWTSRTAPLRRPCGARAVPVQAPDGRRTMWYQSYGRRTMIVRWPYDDRTVKKSDRQNFRKIWIVGLQLEAS